MKEDSVSQLGDYDAPFCEQQYTHGSYYISLFKLKSFDQLIPPNCLKFRHLLSCGTIIEQIDTKHSLLSPDVPSNIICAQFSFQQAKLFWLLSKILLHLAKDNKGAARMQPL